MSFTRRPPAALFAIAVTTAAIVNLPLVYLFVRAVEGGWARYFEHVLSPGTMRLLIETILLVAGVVPLTLGLAVPMAWLVSRTDLPWRRGWAVLCALPLVFRSYVAAFALVAVFGPRGFVRTWLSPFGIDALPDIAYGYSGAVLSLGLFTYPYIYLPLVALLRNLDPALEESARTLGASRWSAFRRVILPQLRAPIYGGSLLVVLYAISDFGAVSIVRYNTLTLGIFSAYGTLFDRSVAAAISTVLVLLTLTFLLAQARLMRRTYASRTRAGRQWRPAPLGKWKLPSQLALGALTLLTVGTPTGVSVFWGIRALVEGNPLSADGFSAFRSVSVAAAAAVIAVVLAVPVSVIAVRHPGRFSRATERLTYSGNALPGLVVALAMVFLVTRYAAPVYQTVGILIAAYVIRFLPEAVTSIHATLSDIAPAFEEAARSLGRTPLQVLRELTLPMIRPGLLAGAGLVFLTTMKELPVTLILRPIGFETLATRIWTAADEGVFSEAALPSLLLLLASVGPVYLLIIRPLLSDKEVA